VKLWELDSNKKYKELGKESQEFTGHKWHSVYMLSMYDYVLKLDFEEVKEKKKIILYRSTMTHASGLVTQSVWTNQKPEKEIDVANREVVLIEEKTIEV
jgi:hypothetical protein